MSVPPRKYGLSNSGAVEPIDWDAMCDRVNGVTLDGVRYSPYTHRIRINGGFYESLDRFHNLEYGGSTDEGGIDGTDAGTVIRAALETTADNHVNNVFIGPGVYNINSLGYDSDEDAYYALAFPEAAAAEELYSLHGAYMPFWAGESTLPKQTSGTLLNITSTAFETAGVKDVVGIWNKESQINAYYGNYVNIENLGVRFPTNQEANSIYGINLRFANSMRLSRLNVDFDLQYDTITPSPLLYASGSAGVATIGSSRDTCYLEHVYVTGYNIGFRFDTEHINAVDCASWKCTYPWSMGQAGTEIYHTNTIIGFQELHSIYGPVFDALMQPGALVNLIGYDMEWDATTAFARLGGATEVGIGTTTGEISYTSIKAPSGVHPLETPVAFWAAGHGTRFLTRYSNYGAWGTPLLENARFYAPLDESAGAAVADLSLYRNNGSITGTAVKVAGHSGYAVSLDGAADYISVTSANNLCGFTDFTVAAWVYPTEHKQYAGIISKGVTAGVPHYGLYLGDATPTVRFTLTNDADETYMLESTDPLPLNAWSLVAGAYTSSWGPTLYVDAVAVDSHVFTGTIKTDTTPLLIGKNSAGNYYFKGYIDDPAVWNRVLGLLELRQIFYEGIKI